MMTKNKIIEISFFIFIFFYGCTTIKVDKVEVKDPTLFKYMKEEDVLK